MKLLLLLSLAVFASARILDNRSDSCDGVIVNAINHEKIVIKDNLDKPYQLALDYDTSILYFSYTAENGMSFISAYYNLKDNSFGTIQGVQGGFANAVDPKSHKIYIGGSDGIYQCHQDKKTANKLDITDENIWQIFVKDGIYFSTYPNEDAYVRKTDTSETMRVPEIGEAKAMLVAVDENNNILYYNSSGLFRHDKVSKQTESLGDYVVNGFTSDVNGKLYFSTPTGVHTLNEKSRVEKIARITNIYGMAIDTDGSIIYATDSSIVKLKSTDTECITELKVLNN